MSEGQWGAGRPHHLIKPWPYHFLWKIPLTFDCSLPVLLSAGFPGQLLSNCMKVALSNRVPTSRLSEAVGVQVGVANVDVGSGEVNHFVFTRFVKRDLRVTT